MNKKKIKKKTKKEIEKKENKQKRQENKMTTGCINCTHYHFLSYFRDSKI